MDSSLYIYLGIVLFAGILLVWLAILLIYQRKIYRLKEFAKKQEHQLITTNRILEEKVRYYKNEKEVLTEKAEKLQQKAENMLNNLATANTENENIKEKLFLQKNEIEKLQQKFVLEFENLANKILKKSTNEFTTTNRKNMSEILTPLKEKIMGFEKKVADVYDKELRDKISLREEVRKLYQLNEKLSTEATNLTKALKGDVKKQGNWGELILERILERSGLKKGIEYSVQEQSLSKEGKKIVPDIIINLPDNKHIVIDSKMSLLAYERYASAESPRLQQQYLKAHIQSLKTHIKNLSNKNYQDLLNIRSLDFVLLFIPIEPAFSLAVFEEQSLYNQAYDKNIILVSPSTLLATLRTIANIWKTEAQNKNALEIAYQAGLMYDKFVGFSTDLIIIGKKMDESKKAYSNAMNKLIEGRGNLVRRVENIKQLGVKTSKAISQELISHSTDE